jgi:hypothetical protein
MHWNDFDATEYLNGERIAEFCVVLGKWFLQNKQFLYVILQPSENSTSNCVKLLKVKCRDEKGKQTRLYDKLNNLTTNAKTVNVSTVPNVSLYLELLPFVSNPKFPQKNNTDYNLLLNNLWLQNWGRSDTSSKIIGGERKHYTHNVIVSPKLAAEFKKCGTDISDKRRLSKSGQTRKNETLISHQDKLAPFEDLPSTFQKPFDGNLRQESLSLQSGGKSSTD